MDSLGDYIYLIVILIAGISSILGKRKKKMSEEHDPMPELPDLEDIIPEYTVRREPERPVYQEIKKTENSSYIPSFDTMTDFSVLKAKKQVNQPVRHFVESEVTVSDDYPVVEIELEDSDDLKKAFIYSEIFNRKYK